MATQQFEIIQFQNGTMMTAGGEIHGALAAAIAGITAVGKDGQNTFQRYSYRRIEDIMSAVNIVLAKHSLSISLLDIETTISETRTTQDGKQKDCQGRRCHYLFSHKDGSFKTVLGEGYAEDTSDKAVTQALSMAFKYMLLHTFCIPLPDQTDGDQGKPTANVSGAGIRPASNGRQATKTGKGTSQAKKAAPADQVDEIALQEYRGWIDASKTPADFDPVIKDLAAMTDQDLKAAAKQILAGRLQALNLVYNKETNKVEKGEISASKETSGKKA